MLSHRQVVAGFVIFGVAAQGTLVELNGTLEGRHGIAALLTGCSHALCVPDVAHIVEVTSLAQGIIRTDGVSLFVVFESGRVLHLHHVGIAQIVVALESGVFGNGFQIHGLRFVVLLLTISLVAHANEVAGTLCHHRQHKYHQ